MSDFDEISDVLSNLAKTLDNYANPDPIPPPVAKKEPEPILPVVKSQSKELPSINLEDDEDFIPVYKPVEARKPSIVEAPKPIVEPTSPKHIPKQEPEPITKPIVVDSKRTPSDEEEPQVKLPSIAQSALEEIQRELDRMPSFDTFFKEKATPMQVRLF